MRPTEVLCETCDKPVPVRPHGLVPRWCPECRIARQAARAAALRVRPAEIKCDMCGESVPVNRLGPQPSRCEECAYVRKQDSAKRRAGERRPATFEERACTRCGGLFSPPFRRGRPPQWCSVVCRNAASEEYVNPADEPTRVRASSLRLLYGMTVEEHDRMLAAQGGRCAICKEPPMLRGRNTRRLFVDHDHATGAIRGLLCYHCNMTLGNARDSVANLSNAIAYLESHRWKRSEAT